MTMDDDIERVAGIIAHRAPEALDYLVDNFVSYEVLARIIDVLDALAEQVADLEARLPPQGGLQNGPRCVKALPADRLSSPASSKDWRSRREP
jgi:hypothetical protein